MRSLLSRICATLALAFPLAASAAPSISVIPTSIDFGPVPIGASADYSLFIQNNGPDTLYITSLTITGPNAPSFSVVDPTSLPLAIRGFHYGFVTVRFTPGPVGTYSATLALGSNDPVTPTVNVPMTGSAFDPAPHIASVRDIPNDQGGKLKLSWDPSPYDRTAPSPVVDHYWVFRSVPPLAARASLARGVPLAARIGGATPAEGRTPLHLTTSAAGTIYWEFVANVQAVHFLPGYSLVVSTTSDSTPASNPMTYFMVVALTANDAQYWQSDPDSGYSVDNLAPATPAPFTAS